MSYHVLSRLIMSYHVLSCLAMGFHMLSCDNMWFFAFLHFFLFPISQIQDNWIPERYNFPKCFSLGLHFFNHKPFPKLFPWIFGPHFFTCQSKSSFPRCHHLDLCAWLSNNRTGAQGVVLPDMPSLDLWAVQPPHSTLECGCSATTHNHLMWLFSHHTQPLNVAVQPPHTTI